MRSRRLLWLLSFSPAIAGLASYQINVLAAAELDSAVDYSLYLSLQSWAVYFGAISALGIVDMKLSPNGSGYSVFPLLGLSIIASLLGTIGLVLVSALTGSITLLVVGITGFIYALHHNLIMTSLMVKIHKTPIFLRLTRAVLLIVLGGALMIGVLGQSSPLHFMGAQALAAVAPISLVVMSLPVAMFSRISATMRKIWMLDRGRWIGRNLSYIVDMSHYPLFYTALGMAAAALESEYGKSVYIAGLLVPAATIVNQMIGERLRHHFSLTDLSGLLSRFVTHFRIGYMVLIAYAIIYVCSLLFFLGALINIVSHELELVVNTFFHVAFLITSSTCGLIMSKAGLESLDLTINTFVFFLLVVFIYGVGHGGTAASWAMLLISSKYMVQLLIAYSKIFEELRAK